MESAVPEGSDWAAVVPLHAPVDSSAEAAPDVTIVLSCFNDARRLGRAIRSLVSQTLRRIEIIIVDDASTDDTPLVVQREMERDSRIRYLRLDENSGGCSAPRNRGIDAARGSWIMFCDSDDVYERHAAKNLLLAAEASGAELGCAVAEQVEVASGRTRRWHAELHETAVLHGIMQRPELIADSLSVNKIYRVDWLRATHIRFPEGILYEDQLFTMQAYASARTIVVLEETSYRWYVRRDPAEASITQLRAELRKATSRIAVNRLIDAFLSSTGRRDLLQVKDAKFLRHDFAVHAAALLDADEVTGSAIVREFAEYLRSMDLTSVADLQPGLRIAVFHVLVGDLPGVQSAMRNVIWGGTVDVRVVSDDAGTAWACEHYGEVGVDEPPSVHATIVCGHPVRWWLDLSDVDPLLASSAQRPWCHVVEAASVTKKGMVVSGSTMDAFGCLPRVIRADLALVTSAQSVIATMPLLWRERSAGRWAWSTTDSWRVGAHAALEATSHGCLSVLLHFADGTSVLTPIRSTRRRAMRIRKPRGLRGIGPHAPTAIQLSSGSFGTLQWQAQSDPPGKRLGLSRGFQRLLSLRYLGWTWAVKRLGRLMPLRDVVAFSAGDGRRLDGDAQSLSVAWHESHPDVEQLWVHCGTPDRVPAWATPVDRRSWRYHWTMARVRWFVLDQDVGSPARPRRGQRNLHSGFGIPLLRMGVEDPRWLLARPGARRPAPARIRSWDALLVASAFADAHVADALGFTGQRVAGAWPWLTRMRSLRDTRLPIPEDTSLDARGARRRRVLLAPVNKELICAGLDLTSLALALGRQVEFTVRRPDGCPIPIPPGLSFAIRDASDEDDTARLVANSDLILTDGSNWALAAWDVSIPVLWLDVVGAPANVQPLHQSPGFTIHDELRLPVSRSTMEAIEVLRSWLAGADLLSSIRDRESPHGGDGVGGSLLGAIHADGAERAWQALQGTT